MLRSVGIALLILVLLSSSVHAAGQDDDLQSCKDANPELSIDACNRVLARKAQSDAARAEAYVNLCSAHKLKGDGEKVRAEKACQKDTQSSREYDLALAACDKAIRLYSAGDLDKDDLAYAYFKRGTARVAKGEAARAVEDLSQAIRIVAALAENKSGHSEYYLNRATAYAQLPKPDYGRAISDLKRAIEGDPKRGIKGNPKATTYLELGLNYAKLRKFGDAIDAYKKGLSLPSRKQRLYRLLGNAYRDKPDHDYELARDNYDEAIRLRGDYAGGYKDRAQLYQAQGKFDAAVADYQKALEKNCNDYPEARDGLAALYKHRGDARLAAGKRKDAVADYEATAKLKPDDKALSAKLAELKRVGDKQSDTLKPNQAPAKDPSGLARADQKEPPAPKEPSPDGYVSRADSRLQQKDYNGAIADYERAITLKSNLEGAAAKLAEAYRARGDDYLHQLNYDSAIADYEKAVGLKPDLEGASAKLAEALRARGDARFAKGDFDLALADYNKLSGKKELSPDGYMDRANAYLKTRDYRAAIAVLSKAIELRQEGYAWAYLVRCNARLGIEDYDNAISDCENAIKRSPQLQAAGHNSLAAAYVGRGGGYREKGDYDRAVADFDHAIALKPDLANALKPDLAAAYVARGNVLRERSDFTLAVSDYLRAIELVPTLADRVKLDLAQAYAGRARANRQEGRYEDALADLGRAIERDPANPSAYALRGAIRGDRGEVAGALADLDVAIKLDSKSASYFKARGLLHSKQQNYAQAINDLQRASELEPTDQDIAATLASVKGAKAAVDEEDRKQRAEAKLHEEQTACSANDARTIDACTHLLAGELPDHERAAAYANRGYSYQLQGERERAIADYQAALGLDPNLDWVQAPLAAQRLAAKQEEDEKRRQAEEIADASACAANDAGTIAACTRLLAGELTDDERADAYANRGYGYQLQAERERAIADYQSALALGPNLDWVQAPLAAQRLAAKQEEEERRRQAEEIADASACSANDARTIAACTRLLVYSDLSDPKRAVAYTNRGNSYMRQGDLHRAMADFEEALSLEPDHPDAIAGRDAMRLLLRDANETVAQAQTARQSPAASGKRAGGENELKVEITEPTPLRGAIPLSSRQVELVGRVLEPESLTALLVDNQPVPFESNGRFAASLQLKDGQNVVTLVGVDLNKRFPRKTIEFIYVSELNKVIAQGERYALVIGNQHYKHHEQFSDLTTPIHDAVEIAEVLEKVYGFKTGLNSGSHDLILLDATLDDINQALDKLQDHLKKQDVLLIYFAGHGSLNKKTDEVYWIPADGKQPNKYTTWFPSNYRLGNFAREVEARSVLFVADACYSGARRKRAGTPTITYRDPQDRVRALTQLGENESRVFISSGADELVADQGAEDHSVFADTFLIALKHEDESTYSSTDLYTKWLRDRVIGKAGQTPQRWPLNAGPELGDFIFARVEKRTAGSPEAPAE